MSKDTIYREDAIKAVINKPAWHGSDGSYYHGDDIRDALNGLPSADRPQGEWVLQDNKHHIEKTYLCSNCENFQAWGESEKYNYCPNCGARMKGTDDEEVDVL